ncbi:MAG: sigma-70 family RNA polymerase sigma factor [Isosphaeraceae bacterium]|nr:sigma-70 family RNA polymerase sigma factor [Isosphaeraceae bacterium]
MLLEETSQVSFRLDHARGFDASVSRGSLHDKAATTCGTRCQRRADTAAPTNVATASDAALLRRYQDSGEREPFDELVRRYTEPLFRYLGRYLGDAGLAKDVLQNTFLQVHLKCSLYRDGASVRPWIYAIATHQAIDAIRRAKRSVAVSLDRPGIGQEPDASMLVERLVEHTPGPLAKLEEQERRRWVRDTVDSLPERSRQVLILAYYHNLKYHEIASILRIPLGTVKSRLSLAIARLREGALAAGL